MGENELIPGEGLIFQGPGRMPRSVLLLVGGSGSGKTSYGVEFMRQGVANGEVCLFVNCSPRLKPDRFNSFFDVKTKPDFIGLFDSNSNRPETLSSLLEKIKIWIKSHSKPGSTRVVLDSLTDLKARFEPDLVQRFVAALCDYLIPANSAALLTVSASGPSSEFLDAIGSLVDGIIQLQVEDSGGEVKRNIRLYSLQTAQSNPKWVSFRIGQDGKCEFDYLDSHGEEAGVPTCKLCGAQIIGNVAYAQSGNAAFHPQCFDTYRKIGELHGSHLLYALEPGVVNANFFFIDIVGLSNPLLSVEKQIKKIGDLNSLILSCDAFAKVPRDRKIVLPTGDGMAIGFLLNPELPLQLSIQLHRKLRDFNVGKNPDDRLGVRIGLSTGPVFVVPDVNTNQNVWGPGIILARRVMDLGNDGHILLAGNIAETLIELKDEYRKVITLVKDDLKLKHGLSVKLYSAYSEQFGNPVVPSRLELG